MGIYHLPESLSFCSSQAPTVGSPRFNLFHLISCILVGFDPFVLTGPLPGKGEASHDARAAHELLRMQRLPPCARGVYCHYFPIVNMNQRASRRYWRILISSQKATMHQRQLRPSVCLIAGGVFQLELFLPEDYPMAPPKVPIHYSGLTRASARKHGRPWNILMTARPAAAG